jgi:uncharacterized protein YggE
MKKKLFKTICAITLIMINLTAIAQTKQNTIKVTGVANISIQSNQSKISASVITKSLSADEAINDNGTLMQIIIDALNSVGIANNNIQTSGFSFSPLYKWVDHQNVLDGYSVSNRIQITIGNENTIGPIIDLLVSAGVTQIDNVRFTSENIQAINAQALAAATNDARNKAVILAKAAKVALGEAVSIISTNSNRNSGVTPAGIAPPGGTGTVILPATNHVNAFVTIEYLIE